MLNAARIGSSWYGVPGTLAPLGTVVPSTTGPIKFLHESKRRPSSPHPMVSIRQRRAVFMARSESIL